MVPRYIYVIDFIKFKTSFTLNLLNQKTLLSPCKPFLLILVLLIHVSLGMAQENKNTDSLTSLADSLYRQGKASKAIALYKEVIDIHTDESNWQGLAESMTRLGRIYSYSSQFDLARTMLNKAKKVTISRIEDKSLLFAKIYEETGGIYEATRQLDSAYFYYKHSLDSFKVVYGEQHEDVARAYRNMSAVYFYRNMLDSCAFYVKKTLRIAKELPDFDQAAIAGYYGNLATIFRGLVEYDSAFFYINKQLTILQKINGPNHLSLVLGHTNKGQFYADLGDYKSAIDNYQNGLDIQNQYPELSKGNLADNFNNLGMAHIKLGSQELALDYFNKALSIQKKIYSSRNTSFGITYNNLGQYWGNLDEYEKAIENYTISIENLKESVGPNHPFVATVLINVGIQFMELEQYDSALYYFASAEKIQDKAFPVIHKNRALLATNKAILFYEMDSVSKGHEQSRLTQEIYTKLYGSRHPNLARSYYNGADIYRQENQLNVALEEVQKSLISSSVNFQSADWRDNPEVDEWLDQYRFIKSLLLKSKILYDLHQQTGEASYLEKSFESIQLADNVVYSVIDDHVDNGDRITLSGTAEELYEFAIKISLERYNSDKDEKWIALTHQYIEKSKAFVLSFTLQDRRVRAFESIPQSILKLEEKLKIDQNFYQSRINNEQYGNQKNSSKLLAYQSKLFDVNRSLDSLIQTLEDRYPNYYNLKYQHEILDIRKVQSQLTSKEALLNYFVGSNEVTLLMITTSTVQHFVFPVKSDLASSVNSMIGKLKSPSVDKAYDANESLEFYERYLKSGIESLSPEINKLIVIPHKNLGLIPFEILATKKARNGNWAETYLINQYTISYGHSAMLLFEENKQNNSPEINYLGYAPGYENRNLVAETTQLNNRGSFVPLKWNQSETSSIGKTLDGKSILGEAATENAFKQNASETKILHLAMHTSISNDDPMNSSLVFYQDNDSIEDGYLHVFELFNMKLKADLAVLSACETGSGEIVDGEGIVSLARGFAYAGVPSIVMSHWQTNDESTNDLMQYFYQNLAEGQAKDDALRNAKITYLQSANKTFSHPFYWAGFVILGNTDSVDLKGSNAIHYLLAIAVICLLLVLFFIKRLSAKNFPIPNKSHSE